MYMFYALFFLFVVFNNPVSIYAESFQDTSEIRYISDFLVINIKDRLERPYTVVGAVKSGDPVRVIGANENYYKVQTSDGKEGWIAKQYIKSDTPAPIVIKNQQREIDSLKAQILSSQSDSPHTATEESLTSCQTNLTELEQKLRDSEAAVEQLEKERQQIIDSGGGGADISNETLIKTQNDNKALNNDLAKTRQEYGLLVTEFDKRGKTIAELQNDLAKQENKTKFLWFGAGAIVFLIGLLAGKAGGKKKSKFTY